MRNRLAAVTLAVLTSLTLAAPASAAPSYGCANAQKVPGSVSRAKLVRAVRCVINAERGRRGLQAVKPATTLRRSAAGHAGSMARNDFFSHVSLDGRTLVDRVVAASPPNTWGFVGEVLGWGCGRVGSPAGIVAAWMASPTHHAVIVDGSFTHLGVTFARGTPVRRCRGGATWTGNFGRA